MHFTCKLVAALLMVAIRVKGQCNSTVGCFPAIGNIALYRNVTANSTCGENGNESFAELPYDGSGSLMVCSADNPSLAYPPSNINDGNLTTSWQSEINVTDDVTVQLNLEGPMLFESLIIVWSTPRPSAMVIERSSDFGSGWSAYRYFATSCENFFNMSSEIITPDKLFNSTEPVCTEMDSLFTPPTDSEITFNTSSHNTDNDTEYQTITNLRLRLLGTHADLSIETEIYYGISEWFVYGTCLCNGHADRCTPLPGETGPRNKVFAGCDCRHRTAGNNCEMCEPLYNNAEYMQGTVDSANVCKMCQCYGHADECFYNESINEGQCICNNYTDGIMCDDCVAGFYRGSAMMFTEACIDCGCFLPGVSDPMICNSLTGICFCKLNVDSNVNTYCDTCLDRYWNISNDNPDGCQECLCSFPGSSSTVCDKTSGSCSCNDNYEPPLCTDCMDGFFQDAGNDCTACGCNPVGAINTSCVPPDGQCYCRENITNTRCSAPANGFFARPLDFFVFEAEDASYPDGTNLIFPAVNNPTNFTGLGFLEITMEITDVVFQFSVSISYRYDLVIRYSTPDDGFSVIAVIQSLSPVSTTLQCLNTTTNDVTIEQSIFGVLDVTPTHGAEIIHTMCLEAGVVYEVTFTFLNFGSGTPRLLLDSIVLIPAYTTESNYLNSPEVLPVHEEIAELCIPSVAGQLNPACDLELVFILSVEFFGQVYRCGCNLVGTEVVDSCSVSSGTCVCKEGIGGTLCDRCIPTYFNFSVNGCTACNCFPPGVVDFTICDPVNGTCVCKLNVDSEVNRICDTCLDGYWNVSSSNPDGCQACQCNSNGSSDLVCDKTFGNCSCYANYTGRTCSECADGYYFYSGQCIQCECHPVGSNHSVCDKTSGQCSCLPNIEGRRCNATQSGFFFRALDYIRFEAENLSYSEVFTEVFPITVNPVYENNFTGRGYITYPDNSNAELRFILTVPKSSQYEIILRYMLSEDTFVIITINSLMPTINSLDCIEVNDSVNNMESLPLPSKNSFHVIHNACLDEGTEYEVTFFHLSDPANIVTFEVDSIVLIPHFMAISNFYNSSTLQDSQLDSCIPRAAGSVPPGNASCDDIAFSLSVETFGQVFECDCDVTGSRTMLGSQCESNGGYCLCKDGVGGERCNQCLNGYYNFSTNGCTACQCDMNNSISLVCDDDGQCSCTFGITDLQCSECEDGFYNFTSNGCQPCTCEQLGSESNNCDKLNGACDCFDGAIGDLCDACPVGTILTNTTYQRFCEPCRCYNRSDVCRVDTETYNLAAITSDFVELCNGSFPIIDNGWVLEGNGVFTICSTNGLGYNTSVSDVDRIVAPANLRGDLTSSYSLRFSVQLQISQIANLLVNMSMVEICGPGGIECLVGQFQLNSSRLQDDSIILLSIPFRETYWQFKNSPNNQPTYLEFLYTLTDVTSFSFSASHAMVETYYLQSISLYTIISVNSVFRSDVVIVEPMFPVEDCQQCFINYTGRFCENCAEGYYRRPGGLDCIACDCNGLSQSCDPQSGICTECRGNSTGNNCELCSRGFYGDPERNISCLPCDCAGLADSTCELDVDGNQTCITCPLGRDGRNCEMCADGYFIVQQDLCFQCQCFGNVIPSDDGSICDMEIGTCINCSFNTTGPQCERCLPGYFGDATGESKCSECTCHVNGTEGLCTNERGVGVCTCRDGTTGKDCDQCLPGYWGLHLGGCRPCECCNHSGAVNESCDQITGRCYCLPGVGGEDDTRCCECSPGSYNLEPGIGCQDCGCSVAAISPQCNENGTCMCTDGAVGEKCDECGFEYSGEIPNCQRCPKCFDNELEYINELTTNITALTITLNQLISTSAPLDNISDIFSKLDSQLFQAQLALQNMSVTRSNVSLLQNKANDTKTLVDMLKQNFTMVSDLFRSINDSVTNDLQVIRMFNGSVYGTTIADVYNRLENISLKISDLNVSSYNSFQILQQRFEADLDFVSVRSNMTESLMRLNATKQSLSIAETLTNSIAEQNLDNRESLSLLFTNISALQSGIQEQLSEAQSYKVLLNSTYFKATALMDALAESEQELLNSSVLIEQLYNYSNSSVNLTTNAITLLRDLHYNVDSLISQTLELLDNITIQQGIVFNATGIVQMANSTNQETLALSTPDIELAQMLAREINSTFLPAAEVTRIATAITNSSVIAQQTLQMAHNASVLVDQISTLVNDTLEKLNASDLLHHHVNNITLPQLLRQREDIEYYAMQITGNLTSLNSSAAKLIEMIDMVLTNAHTTGIDNRDRSIELQANATELCKLTNNLTQQSNELNMSLMNVSSEINNAEEDAIAQLETVQTLFENATALNATAHQVAVQQLQDLLEEYSEDRIRIGQLTETANYLITELDQLIENIEETSATLRDCIRTP